MTPKDHGLMIAVLARQLQLTKALLAIMQSRGLLDDDDLTAFLALVQSSQTGNERILKLADETYHQCAKVLQVRTGLEPPESSS
jgi:hypothetical protein